MSQITNPAGTASAGACEQFWFLNTLVLVRVAHTEGTDGMSVLEHRAPPGDSPPLHVHRTEDEFFYILAGEFRFRVAETERRPGPGEMLLARKGVPHTYRIESPEGGRCLTVTTGGDFERFVREMSRPAQRLELPPPAGPPTSADIEALSRIAQRYGIDLVGPPLH